MPARTMLRNRLLFFYSIYNPEKTGDVDGILSAYKGRENDVMRVVRAKYLGTLPEDPVEPEFGANDEVVALIRQLAEQWLPNRQQDIDNAMQPLAEGGTVAELLRAVLNVPL